MSWAADDVLMRLDIYEVRRSGMFLFAKEIKFKFHNGFDLGEE